MKQDPEIRPTLIVRGASVISDPSQPDGETISDGAVLIGNEDILDIGSYEKIHRENPTVPVIGDGRGIVMPGLIDAHSHGAGLSPLQAGGGYDFLENAFLNWAGGPALPSELGAALAAVKHLRSGATTVHHTGWDDEGPGALLAARQALKAYRSAGIRWAYSPAVRTRYKFCVGEREFVKRLPTDLAGWVEKQIAYDPEILAADYIELFETLYSEFNSIDCRVFFGPSWAHGTDEKLLTYIRNRSAELGGIPIHFHTLQTPHQRAFGLKQFGRSLVRYLDDLGLLGPSTTLGHSVWLSDEDIALLAQREAGTSHHPSCNLLMRNGISPICKMLRAGVRVAIGIDDKSLNDDDDILFELRLASALSRISGFDFATDVALAPHQIWALGTVNAARALGFQGRIGILAPRMRADLIVLDGPALHDDPWISSSVPVSTVVLNRGSRHHVTDVIVNGQVVIRDKKFCTIDVEALFQEVRAYMRSTCAALPDGELKTRNEEVRPHYQQWHAELLDRLDVR